MQLKKAKEFLEGWKNNILRNDEDVEKVAKARMSICSECQYNSKFYPKTARIDEYCTLCGCTLAAKVRAMRTECPEKYWTSVVEHVKK